MRPHAAAIATFLLAVLFATSGRAADGLGRDLERLQRLQDQVEVNADHLEYHEAERKLVASGNVRLVMGERSLFADEASVDLDDQVLVATGHVILMEGLNRLEGDRIEYNYRTNLGVVTAGRGFLAPGISFSGSEIRREAERQYHITEGRFTTCRVCEPEPQTADWEFRTQDATIYQDEWIVARKTSVWLKGIPALFSPIAAFPIGPRRTGFLIPRLGYGNRDGFTIRQPFFWAISPSQDATFTTTYKSRSGVDLLGEYRYILSENSKGELAARYFYDRDTTPHNRAEFKWLHDQVLDPTWSFKADVRTQTQPSLNSQTEDSTVAERTQRVLDSKAFLTQATSRYMLLGLLEVTQDLSNVDQAHTSRLPDLRFQWLPNRVFELPVVPEAEASVVYLERDHGVDTGRFDLRPGVHVPLPLTPWLSATTSAGLRETAYTATTLPDRSGNRIVAELGERLTSRFARRFEEPGFGLLRLTHVVEPSLLYQYVPWTDQRAIPQFDRTDFISPQNRVTYQLMNRLVARWREASGETRTHEVATLDVAQSWNLQPRTREFSDVYLTGLTPERVDQAVSNAVSLGDGFSRVDERTLSNLVFNGSISPLPAVALVGTLAFNTETRQTDAINSGLQLRFPELLNLEVGSSYVRGQTVNGLVGKIQWYITKTVMVDYLTRYDSPTNTFLEHTASLRYSTCCWEVALRLSHKARGVNQKAENSAHVTFDLKVPTSPASR
ncbi:MAG TPA: LPS assembly protein LptD [Candidatus Methylomirabilis sp.]|nr:LPS assembly protein LptD [Candidatus Methylomirabilis sp.]